MPFGLVLLASGCIRPVMVDQKTALERQILGNFQRLEEELILASSVRGSAAHQAADQRLSPLQREALQATLSREFNRDDIEAFKDRQMLGEGKDGLLKVLPAAAAAPQAQRLVEQENRDRMVIIRRVIQRDPKLTDKDLALVRRIFARLMAQTARRGQRVQLPDGRWHTVQSAGSKGGQPPRPQVGGAPASAKGAAK